VAELTLRLTGATYQQKEVSKNKVQGDGLHEDANGSL
jgi:hypothetical protein